MILPQRQSLPLEQKIVLTRQRLIEWCDYWNGDVYLSFSGGKDSTVLLDIIRSIPCGNEVSVVFSDTGLEYPEIRDFAIPRSDVILKPKMTFKEVIEKYGYPIVSKEQSQAIYEYRHTKSEKLRKIRWEGNAKGFGKISEKWKFLVDAPFEISGQCCNVMKKNPFKKYEMETGRKKITAMMACESGLRRWRYERDGCNAFNASNPSSMPMEFWTDQDVLRYLKETGIEYASCYGEIVQDDLLGENLSLTGCRRTGCMFCMFGVQFDGEPNRFQKMKSTHPKQYDYCINKLGLGKVLDYMGINYQ